MGKQLRKEDPNTERFLEYFYKECGNTMFRPLLNLPEWSNYTGTLSLPHVTLCPHIPPRSLPSSLTGGSESVYVFV